MGASASSIPLLEPFKQVEAWNHAQAVQLLTDYKVRDLDFGVDADSLATILNDDISWSNQIIDAFDRGSRIINALAFITGVALTAGGTLQERVEYIFNAFDFDGTEEITLDEMVILLLTGFNGLVTMTGLGRRPTDEEMERIAIIAFEQAGKDQTLSISKTEFCSWATKRADPGGRGNATIPILLAQFGLINSASIGSGGAAAPAESPADAAAPAAAAATEGGEKADGGGAAVAGGADASDLATLAGLKDSHPNNIAAKVFDRAYYDSLGDGDKAALLKCLQSGIQNPDSGMGCYANQPSDYDRFKPFFSKALAAYHGVAEDAKHESDWTLPEGTSYDVETLGLAPLSMRTRVGRNLADFPLPGSMTQADRCGLEVKMCEAFDVLIGMKEYGGRYYSITPGHPSFIDDEEYQGLVKAHIMFKDMAADSYLTSAGIAGDWPHGRGCYVSEDKGFIIWVGEEDHLRIMCMAKSTKIESVFNRLKVALDVVSGIPGLAFAFSSDYGNVTSCPTNLGTGMRSSVHIQLPNLTKDGTDAKAKAICKPLGLSVRGLGGEHTPIGSDGTVDISPSARFCIKESKIVSRLYEGLKLLVDAEKTAGAAGEEAGAGGDGEGGGGGAAVAGGADVSDLATLAGLKDSHPNNIAAKVFDRAYYDSLGDGDKAALLKCLQSGIQNPDSGMGCYANQPSDYDRFKPFFSKALAAYHGVAEDAKHESDWTLPEGTSFDVETLGLAPLSMRTRVGRNLADFPLPGSMTQADRCGLEVKMCEAFDVLIGMKEYGGRYYSITPGHPSFIDDEEYQGLVKAHIMFKDMAADSYLTSAGIAGDWPHGRGCYVSEDKGFIIWVGEEDHLRIMCMAKSTKIESVFNRLKVALDVVSGIPGLAFAFSSDYGNVTSCPTNLGTGMRSSVHIQLPNLTKDGTDAKAKAICKPLGLSVRGLGGEHTPIGSDGTVDISPSARFCIKESEIVSRLYEGLKLLVEAEKAAE